MADSKTVDEVCAAQRARLDMAISHPASPPDAHQLGTHQSAPTLSTPLSLSTEGSSDQESLAGSTVVERRRQGPPALPWTLLACGCHGVLQLLRILTLLPLRTAPPPVPRTHVNVNVNVNLFIFFYK